MCGCPAPFIFETFAQAFCINDDCDLLCWDPWTTAAANLADVGTVTIEEIPLRESAQDQ